MKKSAIIAGAVLAGTLLMGGITLAAEPGFGGPGGMYGHGMNGAMGGGVFGTVTAVNGTTITITSKNFRPGMNSTSTNTSGTTTTYTIDASNATVTKDNASSSVSSIATGDNIMVRGTVNGTSVTATSIFDGMPPGGPGMHRMPWNGTGTRPTSTPMFQGNGEPVVGGTVTAINGSALTITNQSNVTYTVDGSSASVVKGNTTSSLSAVSVNDRVVVQGTVNGSNVTASSIIDQGVASTSNGGGGAGSKPAGIMGRFFGGIGSFFQHIFGFF